MKKFGKAYIILMFAIMYIPLLVMIAFSFNASKSTAVFSGFSLKWYYELFNDEIALDALKNTIILAILNAVISTILGTLAAVGIHGLRNKAFKSSLLTVTNIPMMNPDIVTGISLMLLFAFVGRMLGLINSVGFSTMLIAHITFSLPYVVLNVLPKLQQMDGYLIEAAQDLGSTPIQAFFKIVLPSISSGILSGALMAFTLSIDDFVISHYVSGGFTTLPLLIYNMTKKRVTPEMYAVCTCIFVVVLIMLIVMNVIQSKQDKIKNER